MTDPTEFIIKKLPYNLTSVAGLALVGKYFQRINLPALVDTEFPLRSGVANSDILKSYLALLCQGKNAFDAVEALRGDEFARRSLGLGAVPSAPTLRQRMDACAPSWFELAACINKQLLGLRISGAPIAFGLLPCGYMPLDLDTFAMDNGQTRKEGVGRTYAGVDGYCPFAAYLGTNGYCLELALRPGTQHSASESEYNFERVLPMACSLTPASLLVRADSGFCSARLMRAIAAQAAGLKRRIDFLLKWNPRSTPVEALAAAKCADASTVWTHPRPGKRECVWSECIDIEGLGGQPVRRVYRLCERVIDRRGQVMLLPEYILEGWTTTLPGAGFDEASVIALYADHATHEQFHSEFKSDMDLERLPSGKFDTNYLVCQLAAVALNLLRLMGQYSLHGPHSPLRHSAQRRRIKTVMQELMFKAARMIHHAGRWVLGLSANDRAVTVMQRHYSHHLHPG